jgi:hypothetical protein
VYFDELTARRKKVECSFMADAVEKGKNEPIKIFASALVQTGFS